MIAAEPEIVARLQMERVRIRGRPGLTPNTRLGQRLRGLSGFRDAWWDPPSAIFPTIYFSWSKSHLLP